MTTAAPNKNKAERRPRCKHCRKQFRTTSTTAIFCTRTCKETAAVTKRRIKYVDKATDSAFFKQLAFEASRAGTLEIFTGLQNAPETLAELYKLYAFKLKACQYSTTKDFELSHIYPSQGEDRVGLYHPLNLVVAPFKLNRAHGNQHFGHGLSIDRNRLQPRHQIEKGTPQKTIIAKLIQYIGPDVVAQATKIAGIKPSARATTLAWLRDHLNPAIEQHRQWLESLDEMQTTALKALKATLQGKAESGYRIETRFFSRFEVLLTELTRHAAYRADLAEVLSIVRAAIGARHVNYYWSHEEIMFVPYADLWKWMPYEFLTESELQALFDVLHGQTINNIRPVLDALTDRCNVRWDSAPVSVQGPVVLATLPMPTPTATPTPLSYLTGARSFADFLDGEGLDVVPVLLPVLAQTGLAPQSEPLPWD